MGRIGERKGKGACSFLADGYRERARGLPRIETRGNAAVGGGCQHNRHSKRKDVQEAGDEGSKPSKASRARHSAIWIQLCSKFLPRPPPWCYRPLPPIYKQAEPQKIQHLVLRVKKRVRQKNLLSHLNSLAPSTILRTHGTPARQLHHYPACAPPSWVEPKRMRSRLRKLASVATCRTSTWTNSNVFSSMSLLFFLARIDVEARLCVSLIFFG
ncbi:hypothetical protein V8F20_001305 [Naviculisporaceae sp. PSN 640]